MLLVPKCIIDDLHSKMSRTWWTSNEKTRGWAMMKWERMCYPNGMEGMGFRDMKLFNLALLGRQVWRLMQFKDTLCFRVLSSKYFPEGDILCSKSCDKPSYTWSSIVKATEFFKEGFVWLVGDGNTIDIPRDQW
ncbi:hypothetical protein E1A91_D05G348400v1, partial [Gossypium mustelinum]